MQNMTPRQRWIAKLRYVPLTRDVTEMILESLVGYTPPIRAEDRINLEAAIEAIRELAGEGGMEGAG